MTVVPRSLLALLLLTMLAACDGESKESSEGPLSGTGAAPAPQAVPPAEEQPTAGAGRASSVVSETPQIDEGAVKLLIQQELSKLQDSIYLPLIDSKISEAKSGLEQQLAKLEGSKLPGIESKIAGVDSKVTQVQSDIGAMGSKLPGIESKIAGVDSKVARVQSDVGDMGSKWGAKTSTVGYKDGVYIWTNRAASCPNGQYVAGIKVRYRGSCFNQCDKDGGIIGNIELVCRSLR
jgi:hypothetical protein